MRYKTTGVCATQIEFEIEEGKIKQLSFLGGCNGNLTGISLLVIGQNAAEIASKLRGIKCGFKQTSCPDQLAKAIEKALIIPSNDF